MKAQLGAGIGHLGDLWATRCKNKPEQATGLSFKPQFGGLTGVEFKVLFLPRIRFLRLPK